MILLTSTGRPVRRALQNGLERQGQAAWSPFTGSSLELLVSAIGCRAIVYTAGTSLLAGHLKPEPSLTRARQVLLAAAVPGVELVVGIVPAGKAYVEEEELIQSGDVPSVILRCAPLVEELQNESAWSTTHGRVVTVTTGDMLSTTVLRAIEDPSWRGQTVQVPTIQLNHVWSAPRVVRPSSVSDLSGMPAFACLSCASWW